MGTSKSLSTPSGGKWTPLKVDISQYLEGDQNITPSHVIGGTLRALGGLGAPPPGRSIGGAGHGGGSSGSTGRGGGSGQGGGLHGGRSSVGRAASGLAGFGATLRADGLDGALHALGLDELQGRPAAEVIARIADHLAEGTDPTQYELLSDALKAALMESASLEYQGGYADLEAALQAFLDRNGVEGLVQAFLWQYVYDRVWLAVENHVEMKVQGKATGQAMSIAVGNACRLHVETLIQERKAAGHFHNVDWFGRAGIRLGNELVAELEGRLKNL
jgi:hypothetical protein